VNLWLIVTKHYLSVNIQINFSRQKKSAAGVLSFVKQKDAKSTVIAWARRAHRADEFLLSY